MAWVVDSCILLDVALRDQEFGLPAALLLDGLKGDGLVVCPISAVGVTPHFGGRFEHVWEFLALLGADPHAAWLEADTESAAGGWTRYVALKRDGTVGKRPVTDLLIGGFASRFQGLLTRNPQDFLPYCPGFTIRQPAPLTTTP